MILISHRGNLNGRVPKFENEPGYCEEAIKEGYDVELDIWYLDGWYTGHDAPMWKVSPDFFLRPSFWVHAKNINALVKLEELGAHYFWHQRDSVTLTSQQFIWTFPLEELTPRSICVLPELQNLSEFNCAGLCSDQITKYKHLA